MKRFVLTFDGGGIRGIWPITILCRLFEKYPHLEDEIELCAGTSTGGLISICMAAGMPVEKIRDIYFHHGNYIFQRTTKHKWISGYGYISSKFQNKALVEVFKNKLEDYPKEIKDLDKKLIVPTFDLYDEKRERWKPAFYHNYSERGNWNEPCWKLAVKTSSAPSYFPPFEGYVDGGVVANNPSMIAVGRLVSEYSLDILQDIVLLSLGNGNFKDGVNPAKNWGFLKWSQPLIDIFMEGLGGIPDYQCTQFVKNYMRINPDMDVFYNFDDPKVLPILHKEALHYNLKPVEDFLENSGLI